ncbi:MAG: hypothetical protein ABIU05_06720, partial [Nitrospirales bacterium]
PLAPARDKAATARHVLADDLPGPSLGQQQNHPRPPGIFGPPGGLFARLISSIRSRFVRVIVFLMNTIIVYK